MGSCVCWDLAVIHNRVLFLFPGGSNFAKWCFLLALCVGQSAAPGWSQEDFVVSCFINILSCIPVLSEKTHLPILVDPSHATGVARLVKPMAMAATAAGADGLMIEVHNDPKHALCDGAQSLTPDEFADVVRRVKGIRAVVEE